MIQFIVLPFLQITTYLIWIYDRMEAFEPKWVNYDGIEYAVNPLRLRDLLI